MQTVAELEENLSRPTPGALDALRRCEGDVMVLGAGGKMGLTLARMVRRGLEEIGGGARRAIAVSRFSSAGAAAQLRQQGVETISCDLLDRAAVQALPEVANVLFLAGQKFGTSDSPEVTWTMNTVVPAFAAERFTRSRIVVFSTGCVYPLVPVEGPGASEQTPLEPPGDYANSCVGRERVFTYYAKKHHTPVLIYRLNYAVELRYGVLRDVAQKVWDGEPVEVTMGHANIIWQREANARAIQCLEHAASPPAILNVTGQKISIRAVAERFGELLGRPAKITGSEAPTAWISDTSRSCQLFGAPAVALEEMLAATADWVRRGGASLGKPTHFEVRDGQF